MTAMEYALIAALIAIVIVLALTFAGEELNDFYCLAADWLGWTSDPDLGATPEDGGFISMCNDG